MAWLAVDKNGDEHIYSTEPERNGDMFTNLGKFVQLPKGSIEKLIGKPLAWEDEPVEI